ncbi:SRPBCC family protein [Thalassomonas viridans]|uniref:SRPBCC family protein n=1 Tax=Thalassomonas viridans TaxID=137584 RepID=A0AAE9Z655_9GAMM|nr:SRPBCC family protein [Thalassomonas viridans]WDE05837.1 SRPBCC family protein [Thalassomonas viridans]
MNITKLVKIDRSAEDVWRAVAEQFDQVYKWMGIVQHSYKVEGEQPVEGAPVAGRVCEFTDKPNGLKAEEKILSYSAEEMRFDFDVVPVNAPKVFPVKKNIVTMSVRALADNRAEVSWTSRIQLTPFGYLIYPLLKRGLSRNFGGIMLDLKNYLEQGSDAGTVKAG